MSRRKGLPRPRHKRNVCVTFTTRRFSFERFSFQGVLTRRPFPRAGFEPFCITMKWRGECSHYRSSLANEHWHTFTYYHKWPVRYPGQNKIKLRHSTKEKGEREKKNRWRSFGQCIGAFPDFSLLFLREHTELISGQSIDSWKKREIGESHTKIRSVQGWPSRSRWQ